MLYNKMAAAVIVGIFLMGTKEFLKEKSGKEPAGGIIQPDNPVDVEAAFPIIPGTEVLFKKKPAG